MSKQSQQKIAQLLETANPAEQAQRIGELIGTIQAPTFMTSVLSHPVTGPVVVSVDNRGQIIRDPDLIEQLLEQGLAVIRQVQKQQRAQLAAQLQAARQPAEAAQEETAESEDHSECCDLGDETPVADVPAADAPTPAEGT